MGRRCRSVWRTRPCYPASRRAWDWPHPVAAVLGAAIPAAVTIITRGLPGKLGLAGFLLAAIGIWLISRPDGSGNTGGVPLQPWHRFRRILLCISRTGDSSPIWSSVYSRVASLLLVGAIACRAGAKAPSFAATPQSRSSPDADVPAPPCSFEPIRLEDWIQWWFYRPCTRVDGIAGKVLPQRRFTYWKAAGILAAVAAVLLIALQ